MQSGSSGSAGISILSTKHFMLYMNLHMDQFTSFIDKHHKMNEVGVKWKQ